MVVLLTVVVGRADVPADPGGRLPVRAVAGGAEEAREDGLLVRVLSLGCGGIALGSGVVVPDGRVLTNRHVVAGADYVEVRRADGVRIGASIERVGRDVDLAVLWAGAGVGPGIEPRGRLLLRQGVSVLGHPAGGTAVRSAGVVTARVRVPGVGADGDVAAWVDAPVAEGSSGGPAFTAGELVGVVFAKERRTGLAGVIDGDTAAQLLAGDLPWVDRVACEEPAG
jgi:S1-C subfamily serine protease